MRTALRDVVLFAVVLLPLTTAPVAADHGEGEVLGSVSFPISCRPELQPAFERAVALLHSFGYEPARRGFAAVAAEEPACAMAQWGIAMSQFHPLWAAPTATELATGKAAAERAASLARSTTVTERESGFIGAIGRFYADAESADHKTRAGRYRDAMADLAARFPDDPEATLFHALAILGTASPTDATHAQQRRAAELLVPLVPKLPNHPGVTHYMIHSLDYPELAAMGLDAARRYARIAPSSAHALHMPSHIFIRLGLWPESIASNRDSAASARAMTTRFPEAAAFDALHALDYLAYAHLQEGEIDAARAVLSEAADLAGVGREPTFAAAYALAAIPARLALERDAWGEAASLPLSLAKSAVVDPVVEQRFAYVTAITWFARALGAARSGDAAGAEAAIAEVAARQKRLAASPPAGPYDWAGHVEAQRLTASAWLARSRGKNDDALARMKEAAELEARVGKHPVTPGSVLPARELLGDLYLELERPREALAAYEEALLETPNRLRSLRGAARAAALAGEAERERTFRHLIEALSASTERSSPGVSPGG